MPTITRITGIRAGFADIEATIADPLNFQTPSQGTAASFTNLIFPPSHSAPENRPLIGLINTD